MMEKAVIIGANRTGGTFLACCLSNHPDIHCPRGEIFSKEAPWQQRLNLGHAELLDFVLSETFYQVSMCRLTYIQAFDDQVCGYLHGQHVKVVHLVRDDLAVVTSALLAKAEKKRGRPRHVFLGADDAFQDDEVLDTSVGEVVQRLAHLKAQREKFERLYSDLEVLVVRYEDMTTGGHMLDQGVGAEVCAFLGVVPVVPLWARNSKMHRRALSTYYKNWRSIKSVI